MNRQPCASLTLVGLGPGHPDALTLGSLRAMEEAQVLILRTARHGAADFLTARGVRFEALDALHERCEDFDALCTEVTRALCARLAQGTAVCYAVADPASDATVAALLAALPAGTPVRVHPWVSAAAHAQAGALACGQTSAPWRAATATALPALLPDPSLPLCVTELGSALLASQVKLWLLARAPGDSLVYFLPPGEAGECALCPIALAELDRQPLYDHTCAVWAPPVPMLARERFGFEDLLTIMQILRAPDGCPWDREQTHETLRPYLIEEAYEAVDAIDSGDPYALADELGDVLLQVVFHAQVGQQHASFAIDDVTTAICHKMITRHAHIFGDARCDTAEDVLRNWDKIKQQERGQTTQAEVLRAVPKYLPALMRAAKVQKKAANVGFDWDRAQDALDKVLEEAAELREELESGSDPQEEAGDLLFAAVNALRLAGVQPELALSAATEKFVRRFTRMEAAILAERASLEGMSLADMDVFWARVKQEERK